MHMLYILDISLSRWPVRGVINRLMYKNIYCALCNGVSANLDHQRGTEDPWYEYITAYGDWPDYDETMVDIVEWLPAIVRCPNHTIQHYVENKPMHSKMISLIKT